MARQRTESQQTFELRTWGGKRKGAGRKPKGKRAGMSHDKREKLPKNCPAHITLRVAPDIWHLRGKRLMQEIRIVLWRMRGVAGLRLTQFSVQSNHIHMIVEADGHDSLTKGMTILCARLAARINRAMGRKGQVFPERFHMHILRSPREVEHAIRYVKDNSRIHARREGRSWGLAIDPCTAGPCRSLFPLENRCLVVEPQTWLLRRAWNLPKRPIQGVIPQPVPLAFPWLESPDCVRPPENLSLDLEAA